MDTHLEDAQPTLTTGSDTTIAPTITDETIAASTDETSNYLIGVIGVIVGFVIIIVVSSALCRKWYEKQRRYTMQHPFEILTERKVKPKKWNSPPLFEIEVEVFEKTEQLRTDDDDTLVGPPSPAFRPMTSISNTDRDRYSFTTVYPSLPGNKHSRATSFYPVNENGSSVSLRIPPRSQSKNALDQRSPLKITIIPPTPPNPVVLGWSGLSPPNCTDPRESLLLWSSPGHNTQSLLYQDAFKDEYNDPLELHNNVTPEQNLRNTREYNRGTKFTNRSTFGAFMDNAVSGDVDGKSRDESGSKF